MSKVFFAPTASLSVRWKIRFVLLASTLVTVCLLIFVIYMFQRRNAVREAYEKLTMLRTITSKHVDAYFENLGREASAFSMDQQTLVTFNTLGESFMNIENDNYFTPGAESLEKVNALIEGYYTAEILPLLEAKTGKSAGINAFLPADNKQRILQYLYLAGNEKPVGLKHTVNKADDGSSYTGLHSQYHPDMLAYARQAGLSDILLIDYKSGYVFYSLKKNPDFATNLLNGTYKNSAIAAAYKSALGLPAGSVRFTDEAFRVSAFFSPEVYISAPVFSGRQLIGAVVFTIDASVIDNLLAVDKGESSSKSNLKSFIVGKDLLYRNNDPDFIANPEKYIRKLKRNGKSGQAATSTERLKTNALIQEVDQLAFDDGVRGKEKLATYTTETGERALCSYGLLNIDELNWILVSQADKSDILATARRITWMIAAIALLLLGLLYYFAYTYSNAFSNRVISLHSMLHSLSSGETINTSADDNDDEIGKSVEAVNLLARRINEASVFVNEMGKGNIDYDFAVMGSDDQLGASLNNLKNSLNHSREEELMRQQEDEIRNWSANGIAMFNDILRADNNDLGKLSLNITRNLIQYLKANQGGLFLIEGDEGEKYLNLVASYAYDRQKFLQRKINIGEGLTGTCVLEKKTILLNKIPDNYIEISSGLGGSKPGCLLIVPLKKEDDVLGVIEIASFTDFKPYEVEFAEKVAESIASAMITVRLHLQTSQYLERFQQQTEEMKAQDEELRQNIEELQATHEQMERLKKEEAERNQLMMKEIEDNRSLLISILNEVPEKIFLKDDKGRFIIANKPVADNYNHTVDEILGKSDFDFYSKEEAEKYFKHEQDIIKSGKTQTFEEGDPTRYDKLIVRSIKKPFYIEHLGITGLFGVQFDITDIKRKEYEALKLADEIKDKQQEVETASVELQKEKALLDALLDNVPECIYFKDRQSKFIRFSKSMLTLFGLEKPEELLGKSDFDFFSEEHSRPAFEDEQNIIRSGQAIIDLEEKEVLGDGRVNWVNTTKMPLRNNQGEIIGTFGISKNISRIKKLETEAMQKAEKLIENEEYLKKNRKLLIDILDRVPAKIFLKDENGVFLIVNSAVAAVYNKTADQIIGTSDYDNHPDEDVDSWRKQEIEIMQKGEKTYMHTESTGGATRFLKTIKMPFHIATTSQTGLLGIQFDVTDMKLLEEKLLAVNKEIEKLRKK